MCKLMICSSLFKLIFPFHDMIMTDKQISTLNTFHIFTMHLFCSLTSSKERQKAQRQTASCPTVRWMLHWSGLIRLYLTRHLLLLCIQVWTLKDQRSPTQDHPPLSLYRTAKHNVPLSLRSRRFHRKGHML